MCGEAEEETKLIAMQNLDWAVLCTPVTTDMLPPIGVLIAIAPFRMLEHPEARLDFGVASVRLWTQVLSSNYPSVCPYFSGA